MTVVIVLLVILAIFVIWGISVYNTLIQGKNKVKNAFAQIDTVLQRRFDLIPNLIETVKGYASHESSLLEKITHARTAYLNASSAEGKLEAEGILSSSLKSLFAVAENYPELKANTNFLQLQSELGNTEDKISHARQFYNDTVTRFNNSIATFPNSIIAGIFGFKESDLFKADDATRENPKVQF